MKPPIKQRKLQEQIKKLNSVGELMSNVFFNWSQQERFTPEERKMMKDLQRQWDTIPRNI